MTTSKPRDKGKIRPESAERLSFEEVKKRIRQKVKNDRKLIIADENPENPQEALDEHERNFPNPDDQPMKIG